MSPDDFQTQSRVRTLLAEAGAAPRRRHGQHFLIDRNLMNKLVDAAELTPDDCVLEVGAGTASLTVLLARAAGSVVAIEIDPRLHAVAAAQVAGMANVRLLLGDALASKSRVSPPLLEALRAARLSVRGRLLLVANLPYDIATPLVLDLLIGIGEDPALSFSRMCFTVQAEVADRFLAAPGCAAYGPASVVVQALTRAARIGRAPARVFWPPPRVDSALVRLDVLPASMQVPADPASFAAFVRSFFLHRRKSLGHPVRAAAARADWAELLHDAGLATASRPEEVTVAQWIALHRDVTGLS